MNRQGRWVFLYSMIFVSCLLLSNDATHITADELPDQGLFVAVGYGGRRMASTDGTTWKHNVHWIEQGRDDKYNFRDVCYGDGLFVAVGGGTGDWGSGSSCNISTTRDGETWVDKHPPGGWLGGVAYGNGIFLAVGGNSTFTKSSDGVHWDAIKKNPGWSHYRSVVYGNGVFVAVGDSGRRSVTKEGVHWQHVDVGTREQPRFDRRYLCGLAFGNGLFVAATQDGSHIVSKGGIQWETIPGDQMIGHRRIVWVRDRFIDIGSPETLTSVDGRNWTAIDRPKGPSNLMYASGRYLGWRWGGATYHSEDGTTWTDTSIQDDNAINKIVFGSLSPSARE